MTTEIQQAKSILFITKENWWKHWQAKFAKKAKWIRFKIITVWYRNAKHASQNKLLRSGDLIFKIGALSHDTPENPRVLGWYLKHKQIKASLSESHFWPKNAQRGYHNYIWDPQNDASKNLSNPQSTSINHISSTLKLNYFFFLTGLWFKRCILFMNNLACLTLVQI